MPYLDNIKKNTAPPELILFPCLWRSRLSYSLAPVFFVFTFLESLIFFFSLFWLSLPTDSYSLTFFCLKLGYDFIRHIGLYSGTLYWLDENDLTYLYFLCNIINNYDTILLKTIMLIMALVQTNLITDCLT